MGHGEFVFCSILQSKVPIDYWVLQAVHSYDNNSLTREFDGNCSLIWQKLPVHVGILI